MNCILSISSDGIGLILDFGPAKIRVPNGRFSSSHWKKFWLLDDAAQINDDDFVANFDGTAITFYRNNGEIFVSPVTKSLRASLRSLGYRNL